MLVTSLLIKFGVGLKPPCALNPPADIETDVQPPLPPAVDAVSDRTDRTALPDSLTKPSVAPTVLPSEPPQAATAAATARAASAAAADSPAAAAVGSTGSDEDTSAVADNSRAGRLVSPFEIYCKVPLPDSWLNDTPLFTEEGQSISKPSTPRAHKAGEQSVGTKLHVVQSAVVARRSQSLVAAAAAVGGLVMQQPSTPARGAVGGAPPCIFR